MKRRSMISWLNPVALLALLLTLWPAPMPMAPQAAAAGPSTSVEPAAIGLREHGPVPQIAVVTVGQPVVWTNQGTGVHSVTEYPRTFYVYLPLVLRAAGTGVNAPAGVTVGAAALAPPEPLFDSGAIAPGEQFTYTFSLTGTFEYYDSFNPGLVHGTITVLEPSVEVASPVEADSGGLFEGPGGVAVDIEPGDLITDTWLTVSSAPPSVVGVNNQDAIGSLYNVDFDIPDVISGPITITLPYSPEDLLPGMGEDELRAYFFNGLDWILVPSTVDTVQNTVSFTTTHLSAWEIGRLCNGFDGAYDVVEEADYERARDYFSSVSNYRDLFDQLKTSDGETLFNVRADEAKWLASKRLCDLDDYDQAELLEEIGVDATPQEVAEAMMVIGQGLRAQELDSAQLAEIYGAFSDVIDPGITCLHLIDLIDAGLIAGGPAFLHGFVVHVSFSVVTNLFWQIAGVLEVEANATALDYWLDTYSTEPMGSSELEEVAGDQVAGHEPGGQLNPCAYSYTPSKTFFKNTEVYGEYSFTNLYRANALSGDPVYFVVGLQEINDFYEGLVNPVDHVLMLLEYQGQGTSGPEPKVSRIIFDPNWFITCPTAKVELPDIVPGTEVKVTYYFLEGGGLSKKWTTTTWPENYWLCYDCQQNQPPNQPSGPTPANGAGSQSLDVNLGWSGGDPDGDSVTYDVYFEAGDNTPDVLRADDQPETTFDPGTLLAETTYYWQIIAKDEHGLTTDGPIWSFGTGSAPPPGFITIDPNNGAIDDWSSVPVLRDDPNDDSTYGTDLRYEIDKVWVGNNASPPTEFYFRVDYLGVATSANLYRVKFDCNRNGSFSDAVDVYVDYSPEIDIVVQYQGSGGPGEYYPPPEAFGEAFGTGPSSAEWKVGPIALGNVDWSACMGQIDIVFQTAEGGSGPFDSTVSRGYDVTTGTPLP